jgi:hypothetical protein
MNTYLVTVALEADSLDAARSTVEGWGCAGGEVRGIMGEPEQWAPPPPEQRSPPPPPELAPVDAPAPNVPASPVESGPPMQGADRPAESRSETLSGDETTP